MTQMLLTAGEWENTNSCVVYSFFASLALMLGFTQKQKEFVQRVYDGVFNHPVLSGSFEYQMLQSLGRLPITYHVGEMKKCLNAVQKRQVRLWYEELITLEPQQELNPLLKIMMPNLNNHIINM